MEEVTMENIELLKNIFLFQELDTMELLQFNKILKHRKVRKGDIVIREGELGDQMFIIKSGAFNVYAEDPRTDRRRLLAVLGKGDHFGEIALFLDGPRSATVEAREHSDLLVITRDDMEKILGKNDRVAVKIYRAMVKSLADRLKKTNAIALI